MTQSLSYRNYDEERCGDKDDHVEQFLLFIVSYVARLLLGLFAMVAAPQNQ